MPQNTPTPYDEIAYPDGAFVQSHPDRLAMLGILLGMDPAPVERCRVLELGCAKGSNLIPMAYQFPESVFVGVDYAATQIELAREHAQALNLHNIEFHALNFLDMKDEDFGEYDYILAHGIYSWIPRDVQVRMLEIYKRHLAPQGVAYISYNTLPGWRMYGIGREMMMYRTRGITDLRERVKVARAYLEGIATVDRVGSADKSWERFQQAYDMLLKSQIDYLKVKPDNSFVHDELEFHNDALYFSQFMERASAAGLQFLSETYFPTSLTTNLGSEIREFLSEHCTDIIELEQTLDFLRNRTFRQTLLVHDDVALDRNIKIDRLLRLYAAAPLNIDEKENGDNTQEVKFWSSDREVTFSSDDPFTIECFKLLLENFPREFSIAEITMKTRELLYGYEVPPSSLDEHATTIANNLIQGFGRSYAMVEFRASRAPFVMTISERPVASLVARFAAISSTRVVNQRHDLVTLNPTARFLISHCDGTNDRAALIKLLRTQAVLPKSDSAQKIEEGLEKEVDRTLDLLRRLALLVG